MRWSLRRSVRLVLLLVAVLIIAGVPSAFAQPNLTDLVDKASRAVVLILTLDANGEPLGSGTGTIVRSDGIIFTNRHVIEGGSSYQIFMLEDVNEQPVHSYNAVAINIYNEIDFAVLQINQDANGRNLMPGTLELPFVDFTPNLDAIGQITRMTEIIALGYPGLADYYLSTPRGFITSIQNYDINGESWTVWYQTDAEVAPGHSGGVAMTLDGVPFGIITLGRSEERTGARFGQLLALPFAWAVANNDIDLSQFAGEEPPPDQPVATDEPGTSGTTIANQDWTCGSGSNEQRFVNGVGITISQMRSGFDYTATVIPIGGFDPILVAWSPDADDGLCNDDDNVAARYAVNLPGIGLVESGRYASQVVFRQPISGLADMQLIVGGNTNTVPSGEFLLIIEGMGVTNTDNAGDPFTVDMTESLVASGVPVTVYMLGVDASLDPYVRAVEVINDAWSTVTDTDDIPVECDDAGTTSCWTESTSMGNAFVATGRRQVNGDDLDSLLSISPAAAVDADFQSMTFLLNRYAGSNATGQYISFFHMDIRETAGEVGRGAPRPRSIAHFSSFIPARSAAR